MMPHPLALRGNYEQNIKDDLFAGILVVYTEFNHTNSKFIYSIQYFKKKAEC